MRAGKELIGWREDGEQGGANEADAEQMWRENEAVEEMPQKHSQTEMTENKVIYWKISAVKSLKTTRPLSYILSRDAHRFRVTVRLICSPDAIKRKSENELKHNCEHFCIKTFNVLSKDKSKDSFDLL